MVAECSQEHVIDPYSEPRVNSFHTPFPLFFFYEIFFLF